jgi:hypothetical protein
VRCVGGVSHSPAEAVEEPDVGVALDVLERFLRGVDTGAGAGARAEGVRA